MKRSWYGITVSDTIFPGVGAQISDAYTERLSTVVAAGLEEVAVFQTSHPWETGDFFFSPEAAPIFADIIARYDGVACSRPSPALLVVLGPEDALQTLLGARQDLTVEENDRLEQELLSLRSRIRKLPADDPSLGQLREEERRLESQFEDPDFQG